MIEIGPEAPGEGPAREALLDLCFGRARWFKTCQRLRRDRLPAEGLAFSARDGGRLVGTVRLWNIDAGGVPALLLGPLAVTPERQGEGIGAKLMVHALAAARCLGHEAVLLVGDAPYYAAFGFQQALTAQLRLPGPVDRQRFLALELAPQSLASASGPVCATGRLVPHRRRANTRFAA